MTDRDQDLIALFAQAEQQFDNDAFVAGVMSQIDRERRRTLLVWIALSLFIVACVAAFAAPVITAVSMATQLLPVALVDVQTDWIRQLISPINSVAAVAALVVFVAMKFFRRIFS
jgi:hypothetical protein